MSSMDFRYDVIQLWQQPVEDLLRSPLSLLPLATLGRLPAKAKATEELTAVVHRIITRLEGEVDSARFRRLTTAAFVLTGMKVAPDIAQSMFLGAQDMQDSSTYQFILDEGRKEGRIQGVQRTLLRQGRKQFGE